MSDLNQHFRVLHVSQPTTAGVASYVAEATSHQRRRGWNVAVACPDHGQLPRWLAEGEIDHYPWRAQREVGAETLVEVYRLSQIIRRFRPDVLHLHSSKAGLAGRILSFHAARRHPPTMFQPHGWSWLAVTGLHAKMAIFWEKLAACHTDLVVCVGNGEAKLGRDHRIAGPQRVIRNGVDLVRYPPVDAAGKAAARRQLGLRPDAPVAVCVGRVAHQKGQDLLLAAWPRVRARCPDAELAIVGDGDQVGHLQGRAPAGVSFQLAVDDPRSWYAACDVVVLPSRWEGLSLVCLEALATGRSVVASEVPGLAEVIGSGAGALVPPGDITALADAVAARLGEPGLAAREGRIAASAAVEFEAADTFKALCAATAELGGLNDPGVHDAALVELFPDDGTTDGSRDDPREAAPKSAL